MSDKLVNLTGQLFISKFLDDTGEKIVNTDGSNYEIMPENYEYTLLRISDARGNKADCTVQDLHRHILGCQKTMISEYNRYSQYKYSIHGAVIDGAKRFNREATFFDYATAVNILNPYYGDEKIIITDYFITVIYNYIFFTDISVDRHAYISLQFKTVNNIEALINRARILGTDVVDVFTTSNKKVYMLLDYANMSFKVISNKKFVMGAKYNPRKEYKDINLADYLILGGYQRVFSNTNFNLLDISDIDFSEIDALDDIFYSCKIDKLLHNIDIEKIKDAEKIIESMTIK